MRIVSLNAWGGACFDALAAWLPVVDPDVLCVQEALRTPGLSGWTEFRDAERTLPQRADLVADVAALLPRHQATFLASDSGPVTDADGGVHRQQFGVATFVRETLALVGQAGAFVHGEHADHETWPAGGRPRVAHGVRVVDAGRAPGSSPGRAVTVVQCHGLRDPAGKGDTPARVAQADRLAAVVSGLRRPGDLTVVAGDLNVLPGSVTMATLGRLGLTDLVGERDTRTSLYPKPMRHADYLFVSDVDAVRHFEVVAEPEVSDHRPLLLDV